MALMNSTARTFAGSIVFTLQVVLAGCSGGGGSGSTSAPPPPPPAPQAASASLVLLVGAAAPEAEPRSVDGDATTARFKKAGAMTTTGAGDLLVLDYGAVRKVTAFGDVTTLTESDPKQLYGWSVASDVVGNAYIGRGTLCLPGFSVVFCDRGALVVRDTAGVTTVLAGIEYGTPIALARDGPGSLYYTAAQYGTIMKRSPSGAVTIFFDVGTRTPPFTPATALAIDAAGTLHAVDEVHGTILKISPEGVLTGSVNIPPTNGSLQLKIALDATGNVYVADKSAHVVRKVTPAGNVTTVVGVEGQGAFVPGPLPARLLAPTGVAVIGNDLYIAMESGIAVVRNKP